MHKCLNCGAEFSGNFCPECGTRRQEEKACPNCGNKVKTHIRFCPECGYSFNDTSTTAKTEPQSQPVSYGQPAPYYQGQSVRNNGQNVASVQKPAVTPTDKLGKLYAALKFLPTVLLGLFGLLSLLFFIGPVAVAKAFGESESTSNLYKFTFGSAEEIEILEDIVNFQASGLALFIICMLTIVCAVVAVILMFSANNKFKTVTIGKLTFGLGEFVSYVGTVLTFAAFIVGCVICGQVSTLDEEYAGGYGLFKPGAAPILAIVFGIIFVVFTAVFFILKTVLGKKFPGLVAMEKEKRAADEKAFNEKHAEVATAAYTGDTAGSVNGGSAPKGSSLLNGRPAGCSIISFIRMHRILAYFTLIMIFAMSAATALAWLELEYIVGHVLKYVFWGTFGALLFIVVLSLLIPVNLQKWTPTKILKKGSRGKLAGAIISLFFSLTPVSVNVVTKIYYDIMLREPLIVSIFGVLISVFMIILAVAASKKGDSMSEYFYGSVQNRGNLSVVDYDPATAQQEIKNYKSMKTGKEKSKPDGLMIAAATIFMVVVIALAAIFPTMTNKFSMSVLSELKMRTPSEAVVLYLGYPDEGVSGKGFYSEVFDDEFFDEDYFDKEDFYEDLRSKTGTYHYYSENYRKLYIESLKLEMDYYRAAEKGDDKTCDSILKKCENIEKQIAKLKYKELKVKFDHGKLIGVTYDANCSYEEKDKKVDTLKLSQTNAYIGSDLSEITVQVTYTDGSYCYYRLSDKRVSFERELGRQKVTWKDGWGEYSATVTFENKISGTLGNLSWELKNEDGTDTLSITGSGAMSYYDLGIYDNDRGCHVAPWDSYHTTIDEVRIGERVTEVNDYAFKKYTALKKVVVGNNVSKIGYAAFSDCTSLREVEIGSGIREIEQSAFYNCSATIRINANQSVSYGWDTYWKGSACTVVWNNVTDNSGNEPDDGSDIELQSYEVRFNSNGGSSCLSKTGPEINSLPTPTRSGYHFGGWYESAQFTGSSVTAPYTVSLSGAMLYARWYTPEEWFDGSSFERAITVTENSTIGVKITSANQLKYYAFEPTVSGNYTIESSGNKDSAAGLYRGPDLTQGIASDDNSGSGYNFRIPCYLDRNRTYYIVVGFEDGMSIGSFNFTIRKNNDNYADGTSSTKAITITEGNTISVNMFANEKYYKFTPTVSGSYTIESSGNINTSAKLYDTEINWGNLLVEDDNSGSGNNFRITYDLERNRTYYIVLDFTKVDNCNSFDFTISKNNDQVSDGTSFANAFTATQGTTNNVSITTSGQKIYYKFTPTVTANYTIESSGSVDTQVALYTENNTSSTLASDDDGGNSRNFRLTRNLQSGTTYYIVVNIYGSGTGSFNFTITR